MHRLVTERAVDGVRVTVTCRVLKLVRQPYYRWLNCPVTVSGLVAAHRANALHNAHIDDPEVGYRFRVDEVRDAGEPMSERTGGRSGVTTAGGPPSPNAAAARARRLAPPFMTTSCNASSELPHRGLLDR